MRRESHVRFCEGAGVRLPRATRLIAGFQHQAEARRFWADLAKRFATFGLELHPEKTRLLEFGRFAVDVRKRNGRCVSTVVRQPLLACNEYSRGPRPALTVGPQGCQSARKCGTPGRPLGRPGLIASILRHPRASFSRAG